jgi:hypothetical protein
MNTNTNIIHEIPITLDDYKLKNFDEFSKMFDFFQVSDDDIEKSFGNTGIIINRKFPDSSQKARDLLCVYLVLNQLRNLLVEPLNSQTYTQIYEGYSDNKDDFIKWIMYKIIVKPEYHYLTNDIRDTLEWNLKRMNSNLILDNSVEFNDIVNPPDIADPPDIVRLNYMEDDNGVARQNGASKRKRKSKKSRRSQKKRKGARKTKRQMTTKTK